MLLSHGETPHYHRRKYVSLLSSEWLAPKGQVVPYRYCRQTKNLVLFALNLFQGLLGLLRCLFSVLRNSSSLNKSGKSNSNLY